MAIEKPINKKLTIIIDDYYIINLIKDSLLNSNKESIIKLLEIIIDNEIRKNWQYYNKLICEFHLEIIYPIIHELGRIYENNNWNVKFFIGDNKTIFEIS